VLSKRALVLLAALPLCAGAFFGLASGPLLAQASAVVVDCASNAPGEDDAVLLNKAIRSGRPSDATGGSSTSPTGPAASRT
jgi:hypothetical protein